MRMITRLEILQMQEYIYTQSTQMVDNLDKIHNTIMKITFILTEKNGISDAILFKKFKNLELKYGVNISMKLTGSTTLAVGDVINFTNTSNRCPR